MPPAAIASSVVVTMPKRTRVARVAVVPQAQLEERCLRELGSTTDHRRSPGRGETAISSTAWSIRSSEIRFRAVASPRYSNRHLRFCEKVIAERRPLAH